MASEPTSSYNIAPAGGFKKRRLANACDICRSKNYLQGDSAKMPGNICSNCRAFPDKLELGILLYSLNVCFKKALIRILKLKVLRQLGLATDPIRDMADVDKSLRILKVNQSKYQNAGRMCRWQKLTFAASDIILELISVSKVSSPVMVEQISRVSKRPHRKDSQDNETGDRGNGSSSVAGLSSTSNSIVPTSSYRGIPYSSGIPVSSCASLVADPVPFHGMLHSNPDLDLSGGLTLYTEDLGRLPVHFMVNNYGSTGMQDQVYPSPVPHDNHQDLSTLDSTLDPQGSTGIPHGTGWLYTCFAALPNVELRTDDFYPSSKIMNPGDPKLRLHTGIGDV
ncbi:hypothetical protein F5890DRAFT_1475810 [Lentinula detonsa]|uniref:Uncharacterized protein n=1 Tax=Lentinula detonsa TaxID=2804962 RepID=A0AA38PX19_9AGAR|nr:hypothetical protein F5890DRAFT_1475810 [Lentinula detonsa]